MKESFLLYNLKLNCWIFFYQTKQLSDYIYVTESRVWRVLDWRLTVQLLSATLFLFTI